MKTLLLLALLVSGCTVIENANLGAAFVTEQDSFQSLEKKDATTGVRSAKIGFIEYDDLGFQKDQKTVSKVFEKINELNSPGSDPILMVVFIHGWHHNASQDDTNVTAFKEFLIDVQYEEDVISFTRTKRQVVGVYIGWRGESNEGVLSALTYRSRKSAGLRVGQYGLQEVLAELSKIRNFKSANRLVSIGHSFGGGVLYSSVMQNLVDSVVAAKTDDTGPLGKIDKAYGDLVILMNPALEAARVEVLSRRLSNTGFARCQPLVLASFTSEWDEALSKYFFQGQNLFFYDDKKAAREGGYSQLVTTPYGLEESFRTHELSCDSCTYNSERQYLSEDQFKQAANTWDSFRQGTQANFAVGDIKLARAEGSKIQPGTPIMNIYVKDNNLIPDHNAIWGSDFSLFARALIGMEFAKASECR